RRPSHESFLQSRKPRKRTHLFVNRSFNRHGTSNGRRPLLAPGWLRTPGLRPYHAAGCSRGNTHSNRLSDHSLKFLREHFRNAPPITKHLIFTPTTMMSLWLAEFPYPARKRIISRNVVLSGFEIA